jgi:hypothetical protein
MFSEKQNQPLKLRMDLLEAFLDSPPEPNARRDYTPPWSAGPDYLKSEPGELLIIDLTDPVVDVDMASVLFDTCLSIFLAENAAAKQFTAKLLKAIREQRHNRARIVIATQEPTLDTSLLDLCSITMVHRCSSPAWFEVLKKHVAGLYLSSLNGGDTDRKTVDRDLMRQIVGLKLGESLLFCPTAAMKVEEEKVVRMLDTFVTLRIRQRFTADGGRTKLADSA